MGLVYIHSVAETKIKGNLFPILIHGKVIYVKLEIVTNYDIMSSCRFVPSVS